MYKTIRREAAAPRRRSGTITLATSSPQLRYDPVHKSMYTEVLVMSGFKSNPKRRYTLVDNGDRSTIKNVLGSVTNVRLDGGLLKGEVSWARCKRSQEVASKFMHGHIDLFSVELQPLVIENVHDYKGLGPARIIHEWSVVVAIVRAAHGE
ncbi:MAG: hypothetical protein J0M26_05920 [Planctomycetes bacterium]|nr:hypothetical protein [Planctomycetota bacterium]